MERKTCAYLFQFMNGQKPYSKYLLAGRETFVKAVAINCAHKIFYGLFLEIVGLLTICKPIFIFLLLLLSVDAYADFKGITSGAVLDSLKKLDGTWRSPCRQVKRTGQIVYQQDLYSFRLINLTIKSKLFKTSSCLKATQEHKAKFNYTLGQEFKLESGELVRELNLKEVSDSANIWLLSPLNIVLQRSGTLTFGLESINGQSTNRLGFLDYKGALKRRY